MKNPWGFLLLLAALGLPGLVVLIVGVYRLVDSGRFLSHAEFTQGRVLAVTFLRSGGQDANDTYGVLIEYPLPGGSPRRFSVETPNASAYSVGQSVPIAFVRAPYLEARIPSFSGSWGTPLIFTVSGLLWAGFAGFIAIAVLRSQKVSPPIQAILLVTIFLGCSGDIARWTGRSEGTICLRPGMTRNDAQRLSSITLNTYGDSNRFFDFVLAGEALRFRGCTQYLISSDPRNRIDTFSFASENESWPDLLHSATRTEALLLSHGWTRDPRGRAPGSLPENARAAVITDSGAIDAFRYVKGNLELTVTAYGKWGGLRIWQSSSRAAIFWRSMTVAVADPERDRT